ncbi:MAG: M48 family metallopeptidase [Deltaproteobacteria bacterium]|nr:M48 family metallopeptidase [Deltaproteobacteria bacterium]
MRWKRWSLLGLLIAAACATVPYTNRSQLIMVSKADEVALGADAYREVLTKESITRDPAFVNPVREVGERIARVADRPDYKWEFNVIQKDVANAFALPGGKVAVYTGLFPIAKDTAGLAAVLGHEVGHALARHGAERLSQGILVDVASAGAHVLLGNQSPAMQQVTMAALGLGVQVGYVLPFSRSQESEADHIGLILMAKAGYDPQAALALWQRFERAEKDRPPEFLSTHPNPDTRQEDIRGWLPEARQQLTSNLAAVKPLPAVR